MIEFSISDGFSELMGCIVNLGHRDSFSKCTQDYKTMMLSSFKSK